MSTDKTARKAKMDHAARLANLDPREIRDMLEMLVHEEPPAWLQLVRKDRKDPQATSGQPVHQAALALRTLLGLPTARA